jgi:hypothetical protein
LPKKKIAEQAPVAAVEGPAPAKAKKAPARKARAPRARAKVVNHKHTKTPISEAPAKMAGAEVAAPAAEPSHEEIARLAYSYWEARDYQGGSPHGDWLRAVYELRSRYAG